MSSPSSIWPSISREGKREKTPSASPSKPPHGTTTSSPTSSQHDFLHPIPPARASEIATTGRGERDGDGGLAGARWWRVWTPSGIRSSLCASALASGETKKSTGESDGYGLEPEFTRRGWRRGRDSNPRYGCPYSAFRVRRDRPLCHLSAARGGGAFALRRVGAPISMARQGSQGALTRRLARRLRRGPPAAWNVRAADAGASPTGAISPRARRTAAPGLSACGAAPRRDRTIGAAANSARGRRRIRGRPPRPAGATC